MFEKLEESIRKEKNVFITGQGGSGKSFLVNELYKKMPDEIDITSTTGISSVNIGGVTIHSFSGIGVINFDDKIEDVYKKVMRNNNAKKNIMNCKILIIDEISMLPSYYFEMLNEIFKLVRKDTRKFGGVLLIVTGDFLQLSPIFGSYCFESELWRQMEFEIIYLQKLYRFSDPLYAEILTRVRLGKNTDEDNVELSKRWMAYHDLFDDEGKKYDELKVKPTFLYGKKVDVNKKNIAELESLKGQYYEYKAKDSFLEVNQHCDLDLLAPAIVSYKIGAQVMLTVNLDVKNQLCNGSRGVITKLLENYIVVEFKNGLEMSFVRNPFPYKVREKTLAIREQFPFIIAYAMSIHKCQGATMDCAVIDIGHTIFQPSQAYVALSRVKSLESLYIKSFVAKKIYCDEKAVEFYEKLSIK